MENAIEIKALTKEYPGRVALNDVTFNVKKGTIHGFLGPNGAGKSTTMKIIAGLITPTSGECKSYGPIGFLPEIPPVYKDMIVRDYLSFVFDLYGENASDKKTKNELIQKISDKVGLVNVLDRLIGNLSKGYQQRVGIAQALMQKPEIIILDEPTVGLDPVAISEIRQLILELKKDHTILFSSHQLQEVEHLCTDITLINQGKIVISGEMSDILSSLKSELNIKAIVKNFSESTKTKMQQALKLKNIEFRKDDMNQQYFLTLSATAKTDIREAVVSFLVHEGCGVLEFSEVKSDLEELFKRIE